MKFWRQFQKICKTGMLQFFWLPNLDWFIPWPFHRFLCSTLSAWVIR